MAQSQLPPSEQTMVSIDEARASAKSAVFNFLRFGAAEAGPSNEGLHLWHVENFRGIGLASGIGRNVGRVLTEVAPSTPMGEENVLPIYDVSGRMLFRDFTTRRADAAELRVRTSADKILGAPVFSVGVNRPLVIPEAVARAADVARRSNLSPAELPQAIVCYCYPKLGLLCRAPNGNRHVVDLADFSTYLVDGIPEGAAGDPESLGAISLLDDISLLLIGTQLGRFERLQKALRFPSNVATPEAGAAEVQVGMQQRIVAGMHCIAQENRVWCAVATAKMILDLYGFVHTQSDIAIAMNTASDGTPNIPNQVDAYEALSQSSRVATYDDTPGFLEAQTEINAGRPLKSGIRGHARAVAGWKLDPVPENDGTWLYIYDPWQAQIYWEKLDSVRYLNFIFVRQALIS